MCILFAVIIACSGCAANETATPDFATAILPTPLPQSTPVLSDSAPEVATEAPTVSTITEGTIITQVNIRALPSTASAALGTKNAFTKVQIIGQDSTGSWYQIAYADSSGWVRAEYVQIQAGAEIPIVDAATHSLPGISALVTQKINVRKGPGTNFESVGALNPNDIVFITGKDSSGAWAKIEFAGAADGQGWVAVEFLKIENGDVAQADSPTEETIVMPVSAPVSTGLPIALPDGDSMQAPLGTIVFSQTSARALQLNGDVSAPGGDTEDWLKFTSDNPVIAVESRCSGGLLVELWKDGTRVEGFLLECGVMKIIPVISNHEYIFRLFAPDTNMPSYTRYILNLENMR
jgi:uncharacterized protein YraI